MKLIYDVSPCAPHLHHVSPHSRTRGAKILCPFFLPNFIFWPFSSPFFSICSFCCPKFKFSHSFVFIFESSFPLISYFKAILYYKFTRQLNLISNLVPTPFNCRQWLDGQPQTAFYMSNVRMLLPKPTTITNQGSPHLIRFPNPPTSQSQTGTLSRHQPQSQNIEFSGIWMTFWQLNMNSMSIG